MTAPRLLITADDYGYSPRYDRGILEAARAGAIDAAGAMVGLGSCDPSLLLASPVEIGLHIDHESAPERQLARFERIFGRPPAFLDGHHHCHAEEPLEAAVTELAQLLRVRVRSVGEEHRRRLRAAGVETPDRLVGRLDPDEALVPREISEVEGGGKPAPGVTEWMVHPGYADPSTGSAYDAEREEDLAELMRLTGDEGLRAWRAGETLGG